MAIAIQQLKKKDKLDRSWRGENKKRKKARAVEEKVPKKKNKLDRSWRGEKKREKEKSTGSRGGSGAAGRGACQRPTL